MILFHHIPFRPTRIAAAVRGAVLEAAANRTIEQAQIAGLTPRHMPGPQVKLVQEWMVCRTIVEEGL